RGHNLLRCWAITTTATATTYPVRQKEHLLLLKLSHLPLSRGDLVLSGGNRQKNDVLRQWFGSPLFQTRHERQESRDMSSPTMTEGALPATPNNLDHGNEGREQNSASPMPPPPPFNTPSGTMDAGEVPVAMSSAEGGDEVTGAALANMLSGIGISDNASGDAVSATPRSGGGQGVDEDDDDDDEDYVDEEDNEVELPPEVMKRLYELKALQSEKDV
ncbi:unnamed protein product, partial [Ectocarpus sp. 12 AP-2014]